VRCGKAVLTARCLSFRFRWSLVLSLSSLFLRDHVSSVTTMPFLVSTWRALPTLFLFIAFAKAQSCYFPDGKTVATGDVLCPSNGTEASCCPSNSFCLDNGLCYGRGLVTRSSCTDATWGSPACAEYCKPGEVYRQNVVGDWNSPLIYGRYAESTGSAIDLTPCSSDGASNTFVCGINTTACQRDSNTFVMAGAGGLSLRADQVATILQSVLAATPSATASTAQITVTATPSAAASGLHTSTDMVALGCGLGLPMLLALCTALLLLHRERQKHAKPKLMYNLPDSCNEDFTFHPAPIPGHQSSPYPPSSVSDVNSLGVSQRVSFRTDGSQRPGHVQNFLERYETMKAPSASDVR